eukprot:SAG22_NODE_220_length_14862_cov_73.769424_5_plen_182_part_00
MARESANKKPTTIKNYMNAIIVVLSAVKADTVDSKTSVPSAAYGPQPGRWSAPGGRWECRHLREVPVLPGALWTLRDQDNLPGQPRPDIKTQRRSMSGRRSGFSNDPLAIRTTSRTISQHADSTGGIHMDPVDSYVSTPVLSLKKYYNSNTTGTTVLVPGTGPAGSWQLAPCVGRGYQVQV